MIIATITPIFTLFLLLWFFFQRLYKYLNLIEYVVDTLLSLSHSAASKNMEYLKARSHTMACAERKLMITGMIRYTTITNCDEEGYLDGEKRLTDFQVMSS